MQENNRKLIIGVGLVAVLILLAGAVLVAQYVQLQPFAQQPMGEQAEQDTSPGQERPEDPVERVSEGTTAADIQADIDMLEEGTVLPDIDAETQSIEEESNQL